MSTTENELKAIGYKEVDAITPLSFTITRADWINGACFDPKKCAVANALRRYAPSAIVWVGADIVKIAMKSGRRKVITRYQHSTTSKAIAMGNDGRAEHAFEPTVVKLLVPTGSRRLGANRAIKALAAARGTLGKSGVKYTHRKKWDPKSRYRLTGSTNVPFD